MRSFKGGLLQGLFMAQAMGCALQVAFLGKVVFEPVTATPRGILAGFSGGPVDRFNVT